MARTTDRAERFCDDGGVRWTTVTLPADRRLDGFRDLRDPRERTQRAAREGGAEGGVFVAEGLAVVEALVRSAYPVLAVAAVPEQVEAVTARIAGGDLGAADLLVVPRSVLDEVAGFPVHRGILGLGARRAPLALDAVDPAARTLVVLEECNDHENLGAVARSGRALGADGLVLTARCADPLYRRSVRVSIGEILRLPLYRADPWPDALDQLRLAGFTVVALDPSRDSRVLAALRPDRDERVALVFGAEGPGLSASARAASDLRVRIPIRPEVDSLNVGHAVAVACHHVAAARARSGRSSHPRAGSPGAADGMS
jgi:tRNA G18 (ribose-2'-O)-methylase SpoU